MSTERPVWNPLLVEAYRKMRIAANAFDDACNTAILVQPSDLPSAQIGATVRMLPHIQDLWEDYQLALEQYHWTEIYLGQHNALVTQPKDPQDQSHD